MMLGGWVVSECGTSIHTWPANDLKPHFLNENGQCWCRPTEDLEVPLVWTHNSLDNRESYEQGRKLQ